MAPRRLAKKKQWKRKPRVRKTVVVNRALAPIAQRYITRMKYAEQFTFSAIQPTYRFNLNSIFDPNRTGIGAQPYGHDTLQTMYNRYRVIKATYVITVFNSGSAIKLAALPANEEVSPTGTTDAITNPRCRFIHQYPGGSVSKLKGSIYLPSLVGRTKSQYMADDRYQAQFGSSPSELAVLNLYCTLLNDSGVNDSQCNIEITYTVECFDVKNLPQS